MRILLDAYVSPTWEYVAISARMLAQGMMEAFQRLPEQVQLETVFCEKREQVELPQVDVVVVIDFANMDMQDKLRDGWWKEKTGAKYVFTICECPFEHADQAFCFDDTSCKDVRYAASWDKFTYVPLPYIPQLLKPSSKKPKSVLFDYRLDNSGPWIDELLLWSSDLPPDYEVARICHAYQELNPRETRFERRNYLDYLADSAHFERFVIVHPETYGFSCIDFAARGTQVFAPVDYLRPCIVDALKIQTFSNKEELLGLLQSPYVAPPMPPTGYTSYDELAQMIIKRASI